MKPLGTVSLFSIRLGFGLCLFLGGVISSALAQDSDNDAIAAAKKAATIVEMDGFAQVKPTQFFLRVELEAEGKGEIAARAGLQDIVEQTKAALNTAGFQTKNDSGTRVLSHPKDNPLVWATVQGVSLVSFAPDEPIKVISSYSLVVNSPLKAQEAFAALRATGAKGKVTVYNGLSDDEPARQAALKVAVDHATARTKILNAAAAPKQLDLLFIKQGDFDISDTETSADLQSQKPLPLLATVNAKTSVVLFYGFRSPSSPATPPVTTAIKMLPKKNAAPAIAPKASKASPTTGKTL